MPSLVFPFEVFLSAFVAIQGSILHLRGEGVGPGKRFALCPLGPPLVKYSSSSKALISYDPKAEAVQLVADKRYEAGEMVVAWCGPQPNQRLLLNYGLVEDDNPFDKLQVTITIPSVDPLFRAKRSALTPHGLSTQQTFDLSVSKPIPPTIKPWMRLALATDADQVNKVQFFPTSRGPNSVSPPADLSPPASLLALDSLTEERISSILAGHIASRLEAYNQGPHGQEAGSAIKQQSSRQQVAARLIAAEKRILFSCLHSLGYTDGQAIVKSNFDSVSSVFEASSLVFS